MFVANLAISAPMGQCHGVSLGLAPRPWRVALPFLGLMDTGKGYDNRVGMLEQQMIAAQKGDGRAMADVLRQITPLVRAVVRARGAALPADMHEDVVQEVLLSVHLKRHSWDPERPIRPWLFAIARYKIVDAFRKRKAPIHLPIDDLSDILADHNADTPLADRDLAHLLGSLDQRSETLLREVALDGQSIEDTADKMGLTPGAVRTGLHRARKRLAALLNEGAR